MKKAILFLIVIFLLIATWYFFLKKGDYVVKMEAKTSVGSVNQTIKLWNTNLENNRPINQLDLSDFTQNITFNDSVHKYVWKLNPINDTLTEINLYISDKDRSFTNRFKNLFTETDFEKRSKRTALEISQIIKLHLERTEVRIDGIDTLNATHYAYTSVVSTQRAKAFGMMKDIGLLQSAMAYYNVPLNGSPFVEVTDWNQSTDSLTYNFCFPIKKIDSLPQWENLSYGYRPEQKVLKATYNGNYITSDRAWYSLINYAKSNNLELKELPIEIFYNNPNMGGNEIEWKAEIFMPIIE